MKSHPHESEDHLLLSFLIALSQYQQIQLLFTVVNKSLVNPMGIYLWYLHAKDFREVANQAIRRVTYITK